MAANADGSFIVVWDGAGPQGSKSDIHGRRIDSTGLGFGEFQINTYTTSLQEYPALALNSEGRFVVVWQSSGSSGTDTHFYSIQGQRFQTPF